MADEKTARRDAFDAVWYPWNTLRFPTQSPKIATIHDLFAYTAPAKNFFTRRREQRALVATAREADHIIACSFLVARSDIGTSRCQRRSNYRRAADTRYQLAPRLDPLPYLDLADMPYILMIPGHRGAQNLDVFFEAFVRAFKKHDIRLVLCGNVPVKSQKLFDKISHSRVLVPDDQELRALYRNAAAVAIPASQESFSFTAAEASACAAAIIAANAGALPEIIGGSSLLVDAQDRKEWTSGLQEIIFDQTVNAKLRAQAVSNGARLRARRISIICSNIFDRATATS